MAELYRCKVIENFQGKHFINKVVNYLGTTATMSEDYFYRGTKSLKIAKGADGNIYWDTTFKRGKFLRLHIVALGTAGVEFKVYFRIGVIDKTHTFQFSKSNVWEHFDVPLHADILEGSDISRISITITPTSKTIYIQDIILALSYEAGVEASNIFKIVFPQSIGAYEESWGMRFSRKQIPVAYGGIFQTTGAKGREFSISGMLHEKEQNTAGIIQPMRKLNKEIPYYLVEEGGFNNSLWYPVNITDFDIKKVPSAPFLWKFAIDMEEYTENDTD